MYTRLLACLLVYLFVCLFVCWGRVEPELLYPLGQGHVPWPHWLFGGKDTGDEEHAEIRQPAIVTSCCRGLRPQCVVGGEPGIILIVFGPSWRKVKAHCLGKQSGDDTGADGTAARIPA